jgi:hypothetical protein
VDNYLNNNKINKLKAVNAAWQVPAMTVDAMGTVLPVSGNG